MTLPIRDDGLPTWLGALVDEPQAQLEHVLYGRTVAPGVAVEGILDWIDTAPTQSISHLDAALADWVVRRWGTLQPAAAADVSRIARAWIAVADLALHGEPLRRARESLRSRVASSGTYLGPISTGTAQDPLGHYLAAIGTQQESRELATTWWKLLAFPEGVPLHHLRHGLSGVMGMPRVPAERGRFPAEVVNALLVAGNSLSTAVDAGRLSEERAKRTFVRLAARAFARFPKQSWWTRALAEAEVPAELDAWVEAAFPEFSVVQGPVKSVRTKGASLRRLDYIAAWSERGQKIRRALEHRSPRALAEAAQLIAEEREHATRTSETDPLKLSLTSFSTAVRSWRPELACEWAEEATRWQPGDQYAWTSFARAVWRRDGPEGALPIAVEAVARVPEAAATWHQLGETFRELRCLVLAEEVFLELSEVIRIDHHQRALVGNSLANTLIAQGRFDEALPLFREVAVIEPENEHTLTGLARTLRALGRADKAIDLLEPLLDVHHNIYLWSQYVDALTALGKADEAAAAALTAEQRLHRKPEPTPQLPIADQRLWVENDDPKVVHRQVQLLRRASERRTGAERAELRAAASDLLQHVDSFARNGALVAEEALVLADDGEIPRAAAKIEDALAKAPADIHLRHARSTVALLGASEDPTFTPQRLAGIQALYRQLVDAETGLRPLSDLGAARAALTLRDGQPADDAARAALQRIVRWNTSSTAVPAHRQWWQSQVAQLLVGSTANPTLDEARQRAMRASRVLTALEQELVTRVVAAA